MIHLHEGEEYIFTRGVHATRDVVAVEINCTRVRDGSGPGESGYSSKPAPFGPGMDYMYWTVDV